MSQMLSAGMDLLSEDFVRAGELCESAVADLISAYTRGVKVRKPLLDKSLRVQRLQEEVDEIAAEIIVRLQPEASDLRFVKSFQKTTLEFSRLVKYAYEISDFVTRRRSSDENDEKVKIAADRTRRLIEAGIRSLRMRDLVLGEELKHLRIPISRSKRNLKSVRDTSSALLLQYLDAVSARAAGIGNSVRYITTGEGSELIAPELV